MKYRNWAAQGEEPYRSFIRDVEQAQAGSAIERLRALDANAIGALLTDSRERGDNRTLERLVPE